MHYKINFAIQNSWPQQQNVNKETGVGYMIPLMIHNIGVTCSSINIGVVRRKPQEEKRFDFLVLIFGIVYNYFLIKKLDKWRIMT